MQTTYANTGIQHTTQQLHIATANIFKRCISTVPRFWNTYHRPNYSHL